MTLQQTAPRVVAIALAAGAALSFSGCSAAPTGTATVEIRELAGDSAGTALTAIVRNSEGVIAETLTLDEGTTIAVEDLPLGRTAIEVDGFCEVEAQLDEANPTMRLVVEGNNCLLTD